MPKYKGSGEYYTFRGVIDVGTQGQNMVFPTSPMYQDKDSYAGRNRVWLKSVIISAEVCNDWEDTKGRYFMEMDLGTPSLNSFNLTMGGQGNVPMNGVAQQYNQPNMATNATFWIQPKTFGWRNDENHTKHFGETVGTYANTGGDVATPGVKNGTTLTTLHASGGVPSVSFHTVSGTRKTNDGAGDKSYQLHYENTDFSDKKSLVIGNVWGSQLPITINSRSLLDTYLGDRVPQTSEGVLFSNRTSY